MEEDKKLCCSERMREVSTFIHYDSKYDEFWPHPLFTKFLIRVIDEQIKSHSLRGRISRFIYKYTIFKYKEFIRLRKEKKLHNRRLRGINTLTSNLLKFDPDYAV